MPANRTGVPANGARSPSLVVSRPVDGDARNAASVQSPLDLIADYVAYLQAHFAGFDLAQTSGNAWTNTNDFQGPTGDDSIPLQTTLAAATAGPIAAPGGRKLLWDIKADSQANPVHVRFYSVNGAGSQLQSGFELTINCKWNTGSQLWNQDATAPWACKMQMRGTNGNNVQFMWYNTTGNFADTAWTNTLVIDPSVVQSIDANGVTGTGTMTVTGFGGNNTNAGGVGLPIYGGISFRRAFPSTPGTLTYSSTLNNSNCGAFPANLFTGTFSAYSIFIFASAAAAGNANWHVVWTCH